MKNVYRFGETFLLPDELRMLDTNAVAGYHEVKHESFYAPMFGYEGMPRSVSYQGNVFTLKDTRDIVVADSSGKIIKTIPSFEKAPKAVHLSGDAILFAIPSGVIYVSRLHSGVGYHVFKYDAHGNQQKVWEVGTVTETQNGKSVGASPYLYYYGHSADVIVFATMHEWEHPASVFLNLLSGKQTRIASSTEGMILGQGDSLKGHLHIRDKKIEVTYNGKNWGTENEFYGNAAKTVLCDSVLVVATYNHIATGCRVSAYIVSTGRVLWNGEVRQMMVSHSKYFNNVYLTRYKDKIILEGNEAYGNYLQVLDLKTGKNIFSRMPE
ncbi:MAG: hypothetical protein JST26_01515 [Bacteroidetes bacterium]|nr:hypothetical protein [Bacteroidota bacterium]